jgi:hypothetical protein
LFRLSDFVPVRGFTAAENLDGTAGLYQGTASAMP